MSKPVEHAGSPCACGDPACAAGAVLPPFVPYADLTSPLTTSIELSPDEWRTIRQALAVHYTKLRGQIRRSQKPGRHINRPSGLAMSAADVFAVWEKLRNAKAGGF